MSNLNWNLLFEKGSIIDLNIKTWHAKTKITFSDLGIDNSQAVQKVLSLGNHRLIPSKAFESIVSAINEAKTTVDHHSINFSLIKGARYVPDAQINVLQVKLNAVKMRHQEAVIDFLNQYEQTKTLHLPLVLEALRNAAQDETTAQNAYSRILSQYPTVEELREKFNMTWAIYAIQGAKSQAALEMIQNETATIKDVIGDMVKQLRSELAEKLSSLLVLTSKGGKLNKKSYDSTFELLDRVSAMNILGDTELTTQIEAIRAALSTVNREIVGENFTATLSSVSAELQQSIEQAVQQAEENLTGLGKRKLNLVPEKMPELAEAMPF